MSSKNIFKSNPGNVKDTNTINEAGGTAYALSDKAALTQYALTGTFHNTFYASDVDQLKTVLTLAEKCPLEYVAKLAVYARERGLMKDSPAVLAAFVCAKDVQLFKKIFSQVITDPKMLRNFVQIIRSGVVGRKSFGTAPKKLIRNFLTAMSDEQLFRANIGNDPSLADIIKMIRPKAINPSRNALYAYILDKDLNAVEGLADALPVFVKEFEAFKKNMTLPLPNVPFQYLTALNLTPEHWKNIAKNATWTQIRMSLNTFARHGVFDDAEVVAILADKLASAEEVRRSHVFPYQLFTTYQNVSDVPARIKLALQAAAEIAIENVPVIEGEVAICLDVSGSMSDPITGKRINARTGREESFTTKTRCIDAAGLFAAAIVRKNPLATIIPFDTAVRQINFNPLDTILTNAEKLAGFNGGGTDCGCALAHLNANGSKAKTVIYLSDNQSWIQSTQTRANETPMAREWATYKHRVNDAKLINIDIAPYGSVQHEDRESTILIGGFSDQVFDIVAGFVKGNKDSVVKTIDSISLD